ncbi:MAG: V-type ATPase subunit [Methanolinea sp.]|nr:V-type ATPase subunit [Methanolinea sp.]
MTGDGVARLVDDFAAGVGVDPGILAVLALGLLVFLLVAVVTFIGYFRELFTIARFAYPVARVKAIGNPFVRPDVLARVQEARNTFDASAAVREAGAGIAIPDDATPEAIDRILDEWYISEFVSLAGTVPESIKPFFSAYLGVLETEQLVRAARMVHSRAGKGIDASRLIPVGCLTPDRVRNLDGISEMRELAARLRGTPHEPVISAVLPAYEQERSLVRVENALWKHALQGLNHSRVNVDPTHLPAVAGFLGVYTDVVNILTLLRARQQALPADVVSGMFVPGGAVYEEWRLVQLYENRGAREIVTLMAGTEYYDVLSRALPEAGEPDISRLEVALDRFLLAKVIALSQVHHLKGGPLIMFAVARKFEARNLRLIFHSLSEGVPVTEIGKWLVAEGASA